MDARAAFDVATSSQREPNGEFYGALGDAAIGAGVFIDEVEYPAFLTEEQRFGILRGLVLVLTHECDLDQTNERLLNDSAIICPVIPLDAFVDSLLEVLDETAARKFIGNVSARRVNRLLYLPIIPDILPLGGYLYLNLLSHTHLSRLQSGRPICMASGVGLREIDVALERHLRRPKSDRVPFEIGHSGSLH